MARAKNLVSAIPGHLCSNQASFGQEYFLCGEFRYAQTIENGLVDFLNGLIPIDPGYLSLRSIIVEQANGLGEERIQASAHSFSLIIRALVQFAAIQITDAHSLWRTRMHVVDMLVRFADEASRNAPIQLLALNVQGDHGIDLSPSRVQALIESLRLS
jgi:hypothetical protein